MSYNKLVSQSGKIFYACDKNCPKCKEWNTKGNFWKLDIFFPLHCPMFYHAGYTKDFHIVGNFFGFVNFFVNIYICINEKMFNNSIIPSPF